MNDWIKPSFVKVVRVQSSEKESAIRIVHFNAVSIGLAEPDKKPGHQVLHTHTWIGSPVVTKTTKSITESTKEKRSLQAANLIKLVDSVQRRNYHGQKEQTIIKRELGRKIGLLLAIQWQKSSVMGATETLWPKLWVLCNDSCNTWSVTSSSL